MPIHSTLPSRRPLTLPASPLPQGQTTASTPAVARPAEASSGLVSPSKSIKKRNADAAFGSDIFQSITYGLTNVGQIVPLPAFLAGLIRALPLQGVGVFDIGMGAFNGYKDIKSLKHEKNTRNWDNYVRIGSDAAMVAGGALLLGGAALSPVLPLVGAGLAAAGFFARTVGIWNDESRI
ncbi:MAG: hypothetical protein VKP62_11175 [Candidatus Sericytochromatia bacterium]|nr:hypothetical protein [Candidatus Sericytochromatia bacterium]